MLKRLHVLAVTLLVALATSACNHKTESTWNGTFSTPVARPEHPRPDFRRDGFINLNTKWDFAYDPDDEGLAERWFRRDNVWTHKIQVPFAWEAPLSGLVPPHEGVYSIADTLKASTYRGVAWYRLRLPAPLTARTGYDWHVVFGAVDFKTTVWINGAEATTHVGGYDPFSVNLGNYVKAGDNVSIVLRVEDFTERNDRAQPVGKQGGFWYTRTSGVWQTVYLEQRPSLYITGIHILPEPAKGRARVKLVFNRTVSGRVEIEGSVCAPIKDSQIGLYCSDGFAGSVSAAVDATDSVALTLPLDTVALWDLDTPTLYDMNIELHGEGSARDHVTTYFGMVTVTTEWLPGRSPGETTSPVEQAKALYVNGRPRYLRCVLDQAYYPDGIYTAPSLEAIRKDLEIARSFGFNCIRQHIKSDEPLKYRLMDEMGFFVVYDIVALDLSAANEPGFIGREHFAKNLERTMIRDRNHPSIISWVVFNENWGLIENGSLRAPVLLADSPSLQAWVLEMIELARSLDPTRPLEDNSAGGVVKVFEHLGGDLNSFHYYGSDAAAYRTFLDAEANGTYPGSPRNYVGGALQDGAPWWNSEFASFSVLGGSDTGIFCDLFGLMNEMRRQPKLTGWVLTELTDVEFEENGLVAYDRTPKKDLCARSGVGLNDILGDDHIAFDWLPSSPVTAGAMVNVPLQYSQWSSKNKQNLSISLAWDEGDALTPVDFQSAPYSLTPLSVPVRAPAQTGRADLVAGVFNSSGRRIAANRLTVTIVSP